MIQKKIKTTMRLYGYFENNPRVTRIAYKDLPKDITRGYKQGILTWYTKHSNPASRWAVYHLVSRSIS